MSLAYLECNALSVILCGSFALRVFVPEMDTLQLNYKQHEKKYPVVWLLHDEGGAALDWQTTPAEQCAKEYGVFLIAPDLQHTLCTNMKYGPQYENFISSELRGICQNLFPISTDPACNWVAGVGTGGYGAVKLALKHPQVFTRAAALNGVLDLANICKNALQQKPTGIRHDRESLQAVFGDLNAVAGSGQDLFALAGPMAKSKFCFICDKAYAARPQQERLAAQLGPRAEQFFVKETAESGACQQSLPLAVHWLCKGERG